MTDDIVYTQPPLFGYEWVWRNHEEYPPPGSFDECCMQCADYRVRGKSGEPVSPLFDTIMDTCVSEEIKKRNGGKPMNHGLILKTTMHTGCKFFRKRKTLSEILEKI